MSTMLEKFSEQKAVCDFNLSDEEKIELQELVDSELVIRCDKIPHHERMMNPSYVYVANDVEGRELAKTIPLFSILVR